LSKRSPSRMKLGQQLLASREGFAPAPMSACDVRTGPMLKKRLKQMRTSFRVALLGALFIGSAVLWATTTRRPIPHQPKLAPPIREAAGSSFQRSLNSGVQTPEATATAQLSSSVIAGGGGSILAGTFSGFGIIGQPLVGQPVAFGNFKVGSGFG